MNVQFGPDFQPRSTSAPAPTSLLADAAALKDVGLSVEVGGYATEVREAAKCTSDITPAFYAFPRAR